MTTRILETMRQTADLVGRKGLEVLGDFRE
jgi:hypothetical protein